jgi:hypothetical protein
LFSRSTNLLGCLINYELCHLRVVRALTSLSTACLPTPCRHRQVRGILRARATVPPLLPRGPAVSGGRWRGRGRRERATATGRSVWRARCRDLCAGGTASATAGSPRPACPRGRFQAMQGRRTPPWPILAVKLLL